MSIAPSQQRQYKIATYNLLLQFKGKFPSGVNVFVCYLYCYFICIEMYGIPNTLTRSICCGVTLDGVWLRKRCTNTVTVNASIQPLLCAPPYLVNCFFILFTNFVEINKYWFSFQFFFHKFTYPLFLLEFLDNFYFKLLI